MANHLAAIVVDEGNWLPASMILAASGVAYLVRRHHSSRPRRSVVTSALNLFFALTIGIMSLGHLLAVTTKLALGTLQGSPLVLYAIGVALAVPAWWLAGHSSGRVASHEAGARALMLNVWLGTILIGLGPHNLPLAAPAFFNVAYMSHSRPIVGRALLTVAVIVHGGLFIGGLIFLASGQTFEQFRGRE